MESKPDTIKISASHREEINASHANLFVTVRGSSFVSGTEALKKAKEVSQLVDELTRFGIPAGNIHLQGVFIESPSGVLLKSSSSTYRLRVRCEKLDKIAELLDIVSSQKNAALERIAWKYPDEAACERVLERDLAKAKVKAERIAASLGVKLLGVYDFVENTLDEEAPLQFHPQAVRSKSFAPAIVAEPALGIDIQHSKTIQVDLDIWYRISSY